MSSAESFIQHAKRQNPWNHEKLSLAVQKSAFATCANNYAPDKTAKPQTLIKVLPRHGKRAL